MQKNFETYEEVRETIKTGDLFFTYENSFIPKAIRKITQSKVSHVGIFIWIEKRLYTVEMTLREGCVLRPASNRLQGQMFELGKIATDKTVWEIKDNIYNTVGKIQYDVSSMVRSPWFFRNDAKKAFCSKYVADILGLNFPMLDRGIFPLDVANKCTFITKISYE